MARRTASLTLAASLLAAALFAGWTPPAASEASEIPPGIHAIFVCGVVVNAVGWALPSIKVAVVSITVPIPQSDTTDESGWFLFEGLQKLDYALRAVDTEPHHPERGGAVYGPLAASFHPFDPSVGVVNPQGPRLGACPQKPDEWGTRLDFSQASMPAPGQGFLEVAVTDAARKDRPPLEGALVTIAGGEAPPTGTEADGTRIAAIRTGGNGFARLACASGETSTALAVRISKPGHVDAVRTFPCTSRTAHSLDVPSWRAPVTVAAHVSALQQVLSLAEVDVPVAGASVLVDRTPESLAPFVPGGDLCPDNPAQVGLGAFPLPLVDEDTAPYVCTAQTNAAGIAHLKLPWADADDATPYHLVAWDASEGAADTELTIHKEALDPDQGAGVIDHTFALLKEALTLTATVTDLWHDPLALVKVTLSGNGENAERQTDGDGQFTTEVRPGRNFTLTFDLEGYNKRTCLVDVTIDAGEAVLANPRPAHCTRLLHDDMAAIEGTLVDQPTGAPLPAGIEVCAQGDLLVGPSMPIGPTWCSTTRAGGVFAIEVPAVTDAASGPPGAPTPASQGVGPRLVLFSPPGEPWAWDPLPTSPLGSLTTSVRRHMTQGVLDELVVATSPFALNRQPISFPVRAIDANGTALSGVTFSGCTPAGASDANGETTCAAEFTRHPGLPDAEPRRLCGKRDTDPRYLEACMDVHVQPGQARIDLVLTPVPVVVTPITVLDAHDGSPVAGATVTVSVGCFNGCPLTTDAQGKAVAVIYENQSPKPKICASRSPDYVTATNGPPCVDKATPGASHQLLTYRVAQTVTVTVQDPHTGQAIQSAPVAATSSTPGFTLCPAGAPTEATYACSSNTNNGEASLKLPWTGTNEVCFEVAPGSRTVGAGNPPSGESAVVFQLARTCAPVSSSFSLTLRPLRAATTLGGTLVDGSGADFGDASTPDTLWGETPLPTATVTPMSSRNDGFVCNPAVHDTPGGGFPDCDGVAPEGTTFSLRVPGGNTRVSSNHPQLHLWNLAAEADGHYPEAYQAARPDTNTHFVLWPTTFTARITIQDGVPETGSWHGCSADRIRPLYVYGTDLDHVLYAPLESGDAVARATTRIHAPPVEGSDGEGACVANLTVSGWRHEIPNLPPPVAGSSPTPKHVDTFALVAEMACHAGVAVLPLGPALREGSLNLAHLSCEEPGARLGGTVTDQTTQSGAPGVNVTATRLDGPCAGGLGRFTTLSGPDGRYALPLGCEGTYAVQAEAGPLFTASATQEVRVGASTVQVPRVVDLVVQRTTGPVEVNVHDLLGPDTPVEGVEVRLIPFVTKGTPAEATTGADGVAWFAGVPWDGYLVELTPPEGYAPVPPFLAQSALLVVPESTLPSGVTPSARAYVVSAGTALVSGRVVDADAAVETGVAGVLVTATRAGGGCLDGNPASTLSGPDGLYTLLLPCPGEYAVTTSGLEALYEHPAETSVTVQRCDPATVGGLECPASVTLDVALTRTERGYNLTVLEQKGASAPVVAVNWTSLVFTGTDLVATRTTRVVDENGGVMIRLPWGRYDVASPIATNSTGYFALPADDGPVLRVILKRNS